MKYLLDTQILIWFGLDDSRMTSKITDIFLNPENQLLLSIASIWEMAIKLSLGKLKVKNSLEEFITQQYSINNIQILPLKLTHIYRISDLPFHHRDPFDRILIAQAHEEKFPIISSDKNFDQYKNVTRIF